MWSLGSKKRNNLLDSKERFRKKSLDVKKSQLLLTGRLPWASTNPHNLRPREVKWLVQGHTANMRLQPHTAEALRVNLWPQVGGWTWIQAAGAWLSAPPSNKLCFLRTPFPLNRVIYLGSSPRLILEHHQSMQKFPMGHSEIWKRRTMLRVFHEILFI